MLILLFLALLILTSPADAASATCSTVVVRNDLDPAGFPFGNRFSDDMSVNASGDVVFVARPSGSRHRLYIYPASGADEIVASGTGPAPGGATFKKKPFSDMSMNDAGDLAFRAGLESQGQALLVRRASMPLAIAVRQGGAAPIGGTFDEILEVGHVTTDGQVSFVATTTGGPKGVFQHDLASGTTTTAVAEGAPVTMPPGRTLCTIKHAALAGGGQFAVRANSKVDCDDASETSLEGIYHLLAGTLTEVALTSSPSPVPGAIYDDVIGTPSVNGLGEIAFLAKLDGSSRKHGLFRWDGVAITTEVLVGGIEATTGGIVKAIQAFRLTDTSDLIVSTKFKGGSHKQAILRHGAATTIVLGKSDTPPTDRFALGAEYRSFGKRTLGASAGAEQIVVRAKLKDVIVPKGKTAVILCAP